jgi:hypothetical protein
MCFASSSACPRCIQARDEAYGRPELCRLARNAPHGSSVRGGNEAEPRRQSKKTIAPVNLVPHGPNVIPDPTRMPVIYTLGHSNHPLDRFLELLARHRISTLADVRSRPYSRWCPHFGRTSLERSLGDRSIDYVFLGAELGGRPEAPSCYGPDGRLDYRSRSEAPDFLSGIRRLEGLAARNPTTIMCAEEDPARCHRELLVAPALERLGIGVTHIRGDGRLEPGERRDEAAQRSLFGTGSDRGASLG